MRQKRKIYPLSQVLLERKALYYLGRYASSEKQLERILKKRVHKARRDEEKPFELADEWIAEIIDKCLDYGYLNDQNYSQSMYKKLRRQGKSKRFIELKLREKGISDILILDLFVESNVKDEKKSALKLLRKRRLGAYSKIDVKDDFKLKSRQLAMMARHGFSFQLSNELLNLSLDEIEMLLEE